MPGAVPVPSLSGPATSSAIDRLTHRGTPDRVRIWPIVRCMLAIAGAKRALRRRGLTRTLSALRRRYDLGPGVELDPLAIAAADHIVAVAAAFYPGRAHCLERSLVLYGHLCRLG